jgi:hypothetical protein
VAVKGEASIVNARIIVRRRFSAPLNTVYGVVVAWFDPRANSAPPDSVSVSSICREVVGRLAAADQFDVAISCGGDVGGVFGFVIDISEN